MSFQSVNFKSDFKKIESIFSIFFKTEPQWVEIAETDMAFTAPVISTLINITKDVQTDATVMAVLLAIKKDFVLATHFIKSYDNSKNLIDVLDSLISNLHGFLTLPLVISHPEFKDISAYVNGVVGEIEIISSSMPTTPITPKI